MTVFGEYRILDKRLFDQGFKAIFPVVISSKKSDILRAVSPEQQFWTCLTNDCDIGLEAKYSLRFMTTYGTMVAFIPDTKHHPRVLARMFLHPGTDEDGVPTYIPQRVFGEIGLHSTLTGVVLKVLYHSDGGRKFATILPSYTQDYIWGAETRVRAPISPAAFEHILVERPGATITSFPPKYRTGRRVYNL